MSFDQLDSEDPEQLLMLKKQDRNVYPDRLSTLQQKPYLKRYQDMVGDFFAMLRRVSCHLSDIEAIKYEDPTKCVLEKRSVASLNRELRTPCFAFLQLW